MKLFAVLFSFALVCFSIIVKRNSYEKSSSIVQDPDLRNLPGEKLGRFRAPLLAFSIRIMKGSNVKRFSLLLNFSANLLVGSRLGKKEIG